MIQEQTMELRARIEKWAGMRFGALSKLARELGVKPNTVAQWCNDEPALRHAPVEAMRKKLCKLLNISEDELMTNFPSSPDFPGKRSSGGVSFGRGQITQPVLLPKIAPVVAEIGQGGFQFMFGSYATEYIPVAPNVPNGKQFAAAKVMTDRLGEFAPNGAYLLVMEATLDELQDGKAVILEMGKLCEVGRLERKGDQLHLRSLDNKKQLAEVPRESAKVVGQIVGVYIKRD